MAVRTRATRHAKKAQHARRRQCHKSPTPHPATRMCPKNTHALDRCAYQSCPGNLHNKHASTHSMRVDATQHTQPRACAQKTRTNPLAQGLAQCARPCAVSTVHTGTLCAAVTRERAYTATGQRQKHPGNNTRLHVQARQIGAGAVAVRAHRGGVGVHTGDRVMWVRRGAVRVC